MSGCDAQLELVTKIFKTGELSRCFLIRQSLYFRLELSSYRLDHLKRQCEPHLVETVKGSVETLCTKIYTLSVEHVKKIRERHVQLLKENGLNDPMPAVPPGHRKEEICTPIQFALPPIRLPVVDYQFERDHINLKYTYPSIQSPDTHTLNMTHLQKLVSYFVEITNSIAILNTI